MLHCRHSAVQTVKTAVLNNRGMRRHIGFEGWVTKSANKADKEQGQHKLGSLHNRWLRVSPPAPAPHPHRPSALSVLLQTRKSDPQVVS